MLSPVTFNVLVRLNDAKLDGDPDQLLEDIASRSKAKLMELGFVTKSERGYRITDAGQHRLSNPPAILDNQPAPAGIKSLVRPVPPPATNGNGHHPSMRSGEGQGVGNCDPSCPHKRVLEIVAARYPSVGALLAAVEAFERETL